MKAMFDACCTAPSSQVVGTTPQSPRQVDLATKPPGTVGQQQGYMTQQPAAEPTMGQRMAQPMTNLLSRVEERLPIMAPVAGTMKHMMNTASGTPDLDRMNANLVTGQGEEKQSIGAAITRHRLPIVGVFPASSKCALATLRALTSYPYRNTCAKIVCIVRTPESIPAIRAELGTHVTDALSWSFADYKDERDLTTAFVGLDRLLLVPPSSEDRADLTCNGLTSAKLAGVKHVVLLSAVVAQHPNTMFGRQFRQMENCLEGMAGSLNFTVMRMAWFMDNFLDMAPDLVSNNRFLASWGPSGVAPVALADIGRATAAVLSAPSNSTTHHNRMYHLTGPESLSGFRMAEVFSKVFRRTISYQDLPRDEMKRIYLEQMNVPEWQAEGYVEMNDLFKAGAASAWSTDVPMLTGGNHTTLERFLQSKRWYFTGNRSPLTVLFPASGHIGGHTLEAMLKDPVHTRIRAVVRCADTRAELMTKYGSDSKLEVVDGDFEQPETVSAAFDGADTVLIVPPEKLERFSLIDTAIKIANDSMVSHTILMSVSPAFDATAMGRKFNAWERVLKDNAQSFTIVQSTVFYDMMFPFADQIKNPEHRVHHWFGNGKFCPVDSRDVGEALAAVIREGPLVHNGMTYSLFGPQVLSFADMCDTLGKVLGYKIEAIPDVTSDQVRASLRDKLPSFNVEEVIQAHETLSRGVDIAMTPDLLMLVGRARTIQAFFEDFKSRFTGPPSTPSATQTRSLYGTVLQGQTTVTTSTESTTMLPAPKTTTMETPEGTVTTTETWSTLPPEAPNNMAPTMATPAEKQEATMAEGTKPGAAAIPMAPTTQQPVQT